MKSYGIGLAALAAAAIVYGNTDASAGDVGTDASSLAGQRGEVASRVGLALYRSQLADAPGTLLAWGGGGGEGGGGGGGGGSGGGGSGGGGGGSGGGGSGGGGGGGSGGGGSGGGAAGGTGSASGDSADRGAPAAGTRTDSLGLGFLGATYSATPAPAPDLTVVQWRGPLGYVAAPSPDARLAALDPQVRDQVMARMGKGQTVNGVLDTTVLNQTSRQYAGANAYWAAPEVNAMVVDQGQVRRPVQIDPRTLQPVSAQGSGDVRPTTAELNTTGAGG